MAEEKKKVDPSSVLPLYFCGNVQSGFGRGGKALNCPTANLLPESCQKPLSETENGVYYGWAQVNRSGKPKGGIHEMVMSIGWNPHFNDLEHKTAEAHILHEFEEDFYGQEMKLIAVGHIRGQIKFDSLDELIAAIQNDIDISKKQLKLEAHASYQNDPFFSKNQE
mmetsp:Transcript_9811/g.13218  ORF Transcript_9811/g.13218 Transcript_9811/m.13218 type:complete len:166 (-) Transcript_9811:27-524(-)|eukprot:CAMPEP_0201487780 /NCGR_PEP_ID=MMETSP0151_2-20130828/15223_1 /ASSEMBLY_ACC=CAM_ASM_000257 /TAXON_ID=200890 /ORGANISM="Paramoeba atlantica, Strain 621/1 / CCAP 1560/9" /LENGTH=165 /DNA_ID=CAMNT_0047872925 /DNA_START=51 /DNA_END=548 /DNA_ORIENTATION=-